MEDDDDYKDIDSPVSSSFTLEFEKDEQRIVKKENKD